MKIWECPGCNKKRYYSKKLVMKVCNCCQIEMEINEVVNGRS